MSCVICAENHMENLSVREMHYGTRDLYEYKLCVSCGTLQIAAIPPPEILAKLYPSKSYWSSADRDPMSTKVFQKAVFFCAAACVTNSRLLRRMASQLRPRTVCDALSYGISPGDRVLDIGCGGGDLVRGLGDLGVVEAQGVDPFISTNTVFADAPRSRAVVHPISRRHTLTSSRIIIPSNIRRILLERFVKAQPCLSREVDASSACRRRILCFP